MLELPKIFQGVIRMANGDQLFTGSEPQFKRVTRKYDVKNGARTKAAHVVVRVTGLTRASLLATRLADHLAVEAGLDPERYHLYFEADEKLGIVGGFACDATEPGAMPVRRSDDGKSISFHLGGVFEDYPDLRPSGRRNCAVTRSVDQKGRPYLLIALGTSLSTRTTRRNPT